LNLSKTWNAYGSSFSKYFVSGGATTLLHYGILIGLVELVRVDETVSTSIGYIIASGVHYVMLYHWAFGSNAEHKVTLFRFAAITLAMLVAKTGAFWVLVEVGEIWYLFSQVIVTAVSVLANYVVCKAYIFVRVR
jgi:putative flippase GtrA